MKRADIFDLKIAEVQNNARLEFQKRLSSATDELEGLCLYKQDVTDYVAAALEAYSTAHRADDPELTGLTSKELTDLVSEAVDKAHNASVIVNEIYAAYKRADARISETPIEKTMNDFRKGFIPYMKLSFGIIPFSAEDLASTRKTIVDIRSEFKQAYFEVYRQIGATRASCLDAVRRAKDILPGNDADLRAKGDALAGEISTSERPLARAHAAQAKRPRSTPP